MSFVKKFYVSDTHLGHERLLSMQPRPFSTIDEHDEFIIESWNSVVSHDDIIYHLGDFAFNLSRNADRIRGVFRRLKGRKFLVVGNHDVDKKGRLHPTLASLDWAARPEHALRTSDGGRDLWLSHYAARSWPSQHYGAFYFYGHSHGKLPGVPLASKRLFDEVRPTPQSHRRLRKDRSGRVFQKTTLPHWVVQFVIPGGDT